MEVIKKLTNKQEREIIILKYFSPVELEGDVDAYFNKSENGIGHMPESFKLAKTHRDFHIEMYRKDWKEGIFWLMEAKKDFPPLIFEFICKCLIGFIPEELK